MTTITNFGFGNFAATPIGVVFLSDGSIQQVNTNTGGTQFIAPPGTIVTPTDDLGLSQWGSQYILIVAPQSNGYFAWDGTLFYQAGTLGPYVDISDDGLAYTSQPNMAVVTGDSLINGSSGINAYAPGSFIATLVSTGSLSQITVANQGFNYQPNDVAMIAFSGGGVGTGATAILQAALINQTVGAVLILTGGSGYTPAGVNLSIQGGGGFGATATATVAVSGGPITAVTVNNPGQAYTSPPTVVVTDPNNPVAQATVPIMPFGVQGTTIETYTSRVWIANGAAPTTPPLRNSVVFSAPGQPTNFDGSAGGGNYLDNNSFARVGYYGLKQTNGFMYEIGDSSTDYISGVTTTGTPPQTAFSNQNVDPQVGTPWPNTIQVFSRAIVFANSYGVHALYGGAIQKVSTPLDGIFASVPIVNTATGPTIGGIQPSAAVHIVYGIHIYCLLLPVIDTFTGLMANKIFCWDGQKWFTYQPSKTLIQIASQEINSVLTAYGTDGTSIYPLFNTPSTAINKIVQSKLWDTPSYFMQKHIQRILGIAESNDNQMFNATVSVDTELGSKSVVVSNIAAAVWLNNKNQAATWYNNMGLPASWQITGLPTFKSMIDNNGVLVGLTFQTNAEDMTLVSLMMTGQQYNVTV